MSVLLQYVASSGNTYNLKGDGLRSKTANYHRWSWGFEGTELQFGQRVAALRRDPLVYETRIILDGSLDERKILLENLHEDFELDARNLKPGRIIWGDYYIEAYVRESSTFPDSNLFWTDNDIEFWCPYPFWIKEDRRSFMPQVAAEDYPWLEYAFDFQYDYYPGAVGVASWQTRFPFACEFQMYVFGAANNPRVVVNGYPYQINTSLEADEYLIIDSRKNTVYKYLSNGTTLNIFDSRAKDYSVFQPMPGGTMSITWPGTFGFDLVLFEERSEPRWSS